LPQLRPLPSPARQEIPNPVTKAVQTKAQYPPKESWMAAWFEIWPVFACPIQGKITLLFSLLPQEHGVYPAIRLST